MEGWDSGPLHHDRDQRPKQAPESCLQKYMFCPIAKCIKYLIHQSAFDDYDCYDLQSWENGNQNSLLFALRKGWKERWDADDTAG